MDIKDTKNIQYLFETWNIFEYIILFNNFIVKWNQLQGVSSVVALLPKFQIVNVLITSLLLLLFSKKLQLLP